MMGCARHALCSRVGPEPGLVQSPRKGWRVAVLRNSFPLEPLIGPQPTNQELSYLVVH